MDWEAEKLSSLEKSRKVAWMTAGFLGVLLAITVVSLATLVPLRRTIPYLVKVDNENGNVEVLQPFDSRNIKINDLLRKYWINKYVLEREQYNYWLIANDYDFVVSATSPEISKDYTSQFQGERSLDKVFGKETERRIRILSTTPSPASPDVMVVRFERTTVSKTVVVEQPTLFTATIKYTFNPAVKGSERDLLRNPVGLYIGAYRRDVEQVRTVQPLTPEPTATAAETAQEVQAVQADATASGAAVVPGVQ